MIVNLVGSPCGGKSTFAARFILEHPKWIYCPIDEYRIGYETEERAWHELTKDVLDHRHCVIESCGMNWRLKELLNLHKLRRRPLLTVRFTSTRQNLYQRLVIRQHKRPLPAPFRHEDEFLAIDYAAEHFDQEGVSEVDYVVDTHEKDEIVVYHEVNNVIQQHLLSRSTGTRKRVPELSFGQKLYQKRAVQL